MLRIDSTVLSHIFYLNEYCVYWLLLFKEQVSTLTELCNFIKTLTELLVAHFIDYLTLTPPPILAAVLSFDCLLTISNCTMICAFH